MISIEVDENPDLSWNKRLIKSGLGTIYQSEEIGKYFELQGLKCNFIKFIDDRGSISGQLLTRIYSRFEKKTGKFFLTKIPRLKKNICQWSYGPIIFDLDNYSDVYKTLRDYLKNNNFFVSGSTHPLSNDNNSVLSKYFDTQQWATLIIDLSLSKETLYSKIDKHNGRKNIERSIKRGVVAEKINEKSLYEYHTLRNVMRKESGKDEVDYDVLLNWWRALQPLGYTGFLAKKNGIAIGGLLFSFFNDHIIEGGVARTKQDFLEKLYSQDLIKWKIIEWGNESNKKTYNLAGFNPHPKSKKEEGIQRYKSKWGGKRHDYWFFKNYF